MVLFTNRTMKAIWILGFAAWKAFHAYSVPLLIQHKNKKFDVKDFNTLPGQPEAESSYERLIDSIKELISIKRLNEYLWPTDVPQPYKGKPNDTEGSAIFDLNCMATAYIFLHEIQHVKLRQEGIGGLDPIDEELQCDKFAREMLLGNLEKYSEDSGYSLEKLKSKRAMSIALASFLLLVITPKQSWGGTRSQSSVLGPYKTASDRIPPYADTMAEHMHRAGYQTAVFVSNPHCGTMSSLERGVDVLREAGVKPNSKSSEVLQADFWRWREEYPGGPYWVHFQTTDVHIPWTQSAPFAGLYVDPELQQTYAEWLKKLGETGGRLPDRFKKAGLDPVRFCSLARGLYDETMAHQDDQIGRLVERLKAEGEWDSTLFIVAADHSSSAAGLMPLDPLPTSPDSALVSSYVSHIPMIFVWPGRIKPGQRIDQPVSMIDLLPTILDLAGLPAPNLAQGQSLAPLITGRKGWEDRPVILDEFNAWAESGEVHGKIEMIDGRWGASLKIGKAPWEEKANPEDLRPSTLLLYDLWTDPRCLRSLHEDRPDLVLKYRKLLEDIFNDHRMLAKKFEQADEIPLNSEQLETLRTLGYIR